MTWFGLNPGLAPRFPTPPMADPGPEDAVTDEAGLRPGHGETLRVTLLVEEGATVAQGAPVAELRHAPEIRLVAPMPCRVGRIRLGPGRILSEIVLFREATGDIVGRVPPVTPDAPALRALMQEAGLWPMLRRRPFGGMPAPAEEPAAIVVMATDTRPFAPDPRQALHGREPDFARGLDALAALTEGPVLVCAAPGPQLVERGLGRGRVREVTCGVRHPQGSAGFRVHDLAPASIDAPVWDIHAEDVAALGALLHTGALPMTRLVAVAGAAMRDTRLVRTQIGADLRGLTQHHAIPAPHVLLSGSPLDGHEAHWLDPRHRQLTALPRPRAAPPPHWLVQALTRSSRPGPVIPTAALRQAFGAALPAASFVRALASGDDEAVIRLGGLSLLEDDVALADYALGGAELRELLRAMLDRIKREYAA